MNHTIAPTITTTLQRPPQVSIAIGSSPSIDERVNPHEWALLGEEVVGLETFSGPPAAKLHSSPILLGCSAAPSSHLSGHSLAPPSTGTRPFPVEWRGSREHARAHRQTDIEAKSMVTLFTPCHGCACSGSMVSPDQAQVQRCLAEGRRANFSAPLVAASRVGQGEGSAEWVGIPPGQGPNPISQRHGVRTGR